VIISNQKEELKQSHAKNTTTKDPKSKLAKNSETKDLNPTEVKIGEKGRANKKAKKGEKELEIVEESDLGNDEMASRGIHSSD